jgi:uncharacterized protein YkwD
MRSWWAQSPILASASLGARVGLLYDAGMLRSSLLLVAWVWAAGAVLATEPQPACQPDADQALAALNALRAQARRCGPVEWAAARPLRWNSELQVSTLRFAEELARRDEITHAGTGKASGSLRARLRDAGYAMRLAAENLAGGPESLPEALELWAASPTHCENLMLADVSEVGLACVVGPGHLQRYWVLHLATPLRPPGS